MFGQEGVPVGRPYPAFSLVIRIPFEDDHGTLHPNGSGQAFQHFPFKAFHIDLDKRDLLYVMFRDQLITPAYIYL
jgi:hypothetical protein